MYYELLGWGVLLFSIGFTLFLVMAGIALVSFAEARLIFARAKQDLYKKVKVK